MVAKIMKNNLANLLRYTDELKSNYKSVAQQKNIWIQICILMNTNF